MRKKIQLQIPEPCHEDWTRMTPLDKGRFCTSCQKQVIDFTNMSDQQLIAYFKKRKDDAVCGRFMSDQLQRDIVVPKKRIPWVKYFFQFALPAMLASSKASSQGLVKIKAGKPVIVADINSGELKGVFARKSEKEVRGKIVDEKGSPIPYASIYIKGTSTGTSCDSTGSFSLECRDPADSIVLQASCAGFQTADTILSMNDNKELVVISLNTQQALGEVVVTSYVNTRMGRFTGLVSVIKRQDIFDVIKEKIFPTERSWKFYPNPVHQTSTLTIEAKNVFEGKHLVQLLSTNGQIIMKKEVWIDKNNPPVKLEIPSVPAGVYFLSITNKQSGKNSMEKIVVTE